MKIVYTLFFYLFLTVSTFGQKDVKIPKRLQGVYSGIQSAYTLKNTNVLLEIPSVEMNLILEKSSVSLCYSVSKECMLSNQRITSLQKVKIEKRKIWIIEPKSPNATVPEHIEIWIKEKKVIRQGLGSQPDTELSRVGKKQ